MGFLRPVVFDFGVTEIADLLEHGSHKRRAELMSDGDHLLPLLINQVLSNPRIIVECRKIVKELATTFHVPTVHGGGSHALVNSIS